MKILLDHTFQSIRGGLHASKHQIQLNRNDVITNIHGVKQSGPKTYLNSVEGELILIQPTDEISYTTAE